MNPRVVLCSIFLSALAFGPTFAQEAATAASTPLPGTDAFVSAGGDSRLRREQAYAKLLEGQRHMWRTNRLQTQAGRANEMRLAKLAFEKSVEFDPTLSEGFTALAELAARMQPIDLEESIRLAALAVKADPDNFGGHRLLARLFTVKSQLNSSSPDNAFSRKAVEEWRHVTRLDPRNAEAWAFLSEFSERRGQVPEQIDALRKWISAAGSLDPQFYGLIMGAEASLTPEAATNKLGRALISANRRREAIEILSALIADEPGNAEAIGLLGEAVETADADSARKALQGLQQAVFASPDNVALVDLLARLQSRLGQFENAEKLLRSSAQKLSATDTRASSTLLISLADLYLEKDRYSDASEVIEKSLAVRGIGQASRAADENREFAVYVFEKLIHVYKLSEKPREARAVIERARGFFDKDDLFADRQNILHLRYIGDRAGAVAAVRSARARRPNDIGLLRLEATLLAASGKIDAAAAAIRDSMKSVPGLEASGPNSSVAPSPAYDEFSNLLFISNLYSGANRPKEAAEAANRAFAIAAGSERKQIARLTLATAQQMAGEFAAAESTLREVLKQTPGNPIALNNLGYFLVERNERLDEALDLIRQALKIDPRNPSYLDSLGWALFKLGKLSDAEQQLKSAARMDADSATIQEHLGDVYAGMQNKESAKQAWEKALRLSSDPAAITRLKGKVK